MWACIRTVLCARCYEPAQTFDLDQLDSADLIASYWMGPAIAHIFVSFGFRACRSRSLEKYSRIDMEAHAEAGRID